MSLDLSEAERLFLETADNGRAIEFEFSTEQDMKKQRYKLYWLARQHEMYFRSLVSERLDLPGGFRLKAWVVRAAPSGPSPEEQSEWA